MNQTMPHWLSKQAELNPYKIAIETNAKSLTFLELKNESQVFAKKLASFGVKQHARVAVLSANHLDMVIAIHALSYLNAVVVLLNTRLSKQELHYQLEQSEATFLILTEGLKDEKNLAFQKQKTFQDVRNQHEVDASLSTHIDLNVPFTMMFTSGTTGLPKGVIHTYGNHWWSAIGSVLNLGLTEKDKWLLMLPMFHVGGLSILIRSVIYGMSVYLLEKYDAQFVYRAIVQKRITILSVVTLMLRELLEEMGKEELPSYVRCLLLGGGSVPDDLLQQVREKNIPLFQSYGLTETSSQIVTLSKEDALEKLGSAGKPLFPAEIKIANQNHEGVGEIWVKGPMVMDGYIKDETANKLAFENGWFKTGDIGYLDSEGFLYVVDRRSDLIISGGENIYPSEVENKILQLEYVHEAAVVGKKDDDWGQVPVAFVVRESDQLSEKTIQDYLKDVLATYKIPKKIIFRESLPKNASNKIMRHQLKKQLGEHS